MKVVILAGGLGTRLTEETELIPLGNARGFDNRLHSAA